MKELRMMISAVLVALASSTYAQPGTIKDLFFPDRYENRQIAYHSEAESNSSWEAGPDGRITRIRPNQAELPSVLRTGYSLHAEVIYEAEESWTEQALALESWMSVPFEPEFVEEELEIEPWMMEPFEVPKGTRLP